MKLFNVILVSAIFMLSATVGLLNAQTVLTSEEASKVLRFETLNTQSGISGVVVNRSPYTVKDVEILIQYHWLWEDERNPGQDPLGRAVFLKLDGPIGPGQSLRFSYTPMPPLPSRDDGHFMPEVGVAAFTTVVPQQLAAG